MKETFSDITESTSLILVKKFLPTNLREARYSLLL